MSRSKLAALLCSFALMFSGATMVLATGQSVQICHATDSETNPYNGESPAIDSTGYLHGGHADHTGPVWYPGAKAADVVWGDIIPPYDYVLDNGTTFHYPGLNWSAEGQAIYNNDCRAFADIHVEKTPSVDSLPDGGGDVTYTYVVTNSGQLPLTNVTVTDDKCSPVAYQSGDANSDDTLDLTETWTYTCTTTLTTTTTNHVHATGQDGDTTVWDDDEATVTVLPPEDNPAVSIDKTADPETLPSGGGDVTYTYVVTNTGNVSIFDISVTDDNGTVDTGDDFDVTCPSDTLAAGDSMTCTADLHITEDTTNVATVTANWDDCHDDCSAPVPPDTDDATVTVEAAPNAPAIHIDKTPSVTDLPSTGGDVTYTYAVTNIGDVALTAVTVTDDKCDPVAFVSGDTNSDDILDLTETWTYSCTATLTETTTNTALATGHDGETAVTDTDEATVTVAPAPGTPGINVAKTASVTDLPSVGGDVTYTYVVTNTGSVPLTSVTVTDDKCDPVSFVSGDTNTDDILDVTETWTYSCTATLTATTTNTALATGHDGETAVTDTDEATVTVAKPGGGVGGETSPPKTTLPPTDTISAATSSSTGDNSLPYLLIVLGIIGFGAVLLTPTRPRR